VKRWVGASAAVGSATAVVVAGSAWAGPVGTASLDVTSPENQAWAYDCGHRDWLEARVVPGAGGDVLVVGAVDGPGDPVEAAFDATTVRLAAQSGAVAAGARSAELRWPLVGQAGMREVRVEATFDDGITRCAWTVQLPAPPPAVIGEAPSHSNRGRSGHPSRVTW
jgi:hypothetical protein